MPWLQFPPLLHSRKPLGRLKGKDVIWGRTTLLRSFEKGKEFLCLKCAVPCNWASDLSKHTSMWGIYCGDLLCRILGSGSLRHSLIFLKLFIYLEASVPEKGRERERSSSCWFTPQVTVIARSGLDGSQRQQLHLVFHASGKDSSTWTILFLLRCVRSWIITGLTQPTLN